MTMDLPIRGLSPRQHQVAILVVRGLSNKGIAKECKLSVKTVEEYLTRICERLGGEGRPRVRIIRWYYSENRDAA
jgi:DNA-binding NarL/FixJ family response regulator